MPIGLLKVTQQGAAEFNTATNTSTDVPGDSAGLRAKSDVYDFPVVVKLDMVVVVGIITVRDLKSSVRDLSMSNLHSLPQSLSVSQRLDETAESF